MPQVYNKHRTNAPHTAVYVGRPSVWGNPFSHLDSAQSTVVVATREDAVQAHKDWIRSQPALLAAVKLELRGKDLVCWCAPQACHADTLMQIANEENTLEGYVTKVESRTTKFGDYWDVHAGGKKLGVGKFPPKGISVGDYVRFETEMKGQYENLVAGSLSKIDPPAGTKAPAPPQPSAITMDRQDVISRQAALNSGLAFLEILATNGAIPEGKTLTPAKKADKLEAILMEYVQKFHRLSTGVEYDLPEDSVAESAENWDEE